MPDTCSRSQGSDQHPANHHGCDDVSANEHDAGLPTADPTQQKIFKFPPSCSDLPLQFLFRSGALLDDAEYPDHRAAEDYQRDAGRATESAAASATGGKGARSKSKESKPLSRPGGAADSADTGAQA